MTQKLYLKALQIRLVEEALLWLSREGHLRGTLHTCLGQEMISAVFSEHVQPRDYVFSNHRCHGHFLATHDLAYELIAELLGKEDGLCHGVGGSQHLHHGKFYSNGIVAGLAPVAAGVAFVQKRQHSNGLVVNFLGDGALGEGVLYEALNLSSLHQLPQLFILENNLYAQSTAQHEVLAGSIEARARAFGLRFLKANIWDLQELRAQMTIAFRETRQGGPTFFQIDCYRLAAHSRGDDHRNPVEIESFRAKDPLRVFREQARGELEAACRALEEQVRRTVERALAAAPSQAKSFLTESQALGLKPGILSETPLSHQLNLALRRALETDPQLLLVGEDLRAPYGGAFKVTRDLSSEFSDRVMNFPISEALLAGFCSGVALAENRIIGEIMFSDFLGLAFDQLLNHAVKFQGMYGKKVHCPFILRTPSGGHRSYGATHSQSLEKHFAGIPGLNVLLLHHRAVYPDFFVDLLASITGPTIVFENKGLYSWHGTALPDHWSLSLTPGFSSLIRPAHPADLTIVAFGGAALLAEEAARELETEEIFIDLIFPLLIHRTDLAPLIESLRGTRKLIVIEEGTQGLSLGSELVAALQGKVLFQVKMLSTPQGAIPFASHLEQDFLMNREKILNASLELFDED